MFKLDSLAKKIGFGYVIVGMMLSIAVGTTVYLVHDTARISDDLREHRVPTSQAGLTVLAGINQSLAALRGWMILGDESFLDERELAWESKIHSGLKLLDELSLRWDKQEDRDRLLVIKTKVRKFERYQQEIEEIANRDENFPAIVVFTSQVKPLADSLIDKITEIENVEERGLRGENNLSNGKRLVVYESTLALLSATEALLVEAEGYLLTGSEMAHLSYRSEVNNYMAVIDELVSLRADFDPESQEMLRKAFQLSERLTPLIDEMVNLRRGDEWNVASFWLRTRAAPSANEMIELLESIIESSQTSMNEQFTESRQQSVLLNWIEWGLLIIGLSFCIIMGFLITRSVSVPIQRTLAVADAVAQGDFDIDTDFEGSKEIVSLGQSLGAMTASLRETTEAAEAVAAGRLNVEVVVKGDNDRLAMSVNSMLEAIRTSKNETEKQLAALTDSESRSNSIISNMEDGLVNINSDGIITLFNPAAEKIFQYTEDEVIGRNIRILVPSPHSEKHDSYLSTYLRTGDRRFIGAPRDVQAQRKDGSTFPASIVVSEIVVAGKKNFIGTVRDFTKQKRIEEKEIAAKAALEAEKEKLIEQDWLKGSYANVVEGVQGSRSLKEMCDTLMNTMMPLINGHVGVFYIRQGVELSASVGVNKSDVFSIISSYAYKVRNTVVNEYAIGEGIVGQVALERKPIVINNVGDSLLGIDTGVGQLMAGTVMVYPILFEGDLLGVVEVGTATKFTRQQEELLEQIVNNIGVFISTVVGRSRAENLLEKSEAQSKVLLQRENELKEANVEMIRKTNAAEQANRTKSEFLANMSHELRTPLNSLLILAESLSSNRDGNLTGQQQEAASIIHQSGSDLLTLINDILDLAKVEAGKMTLNNDHFLIKDIEASISNQFSHVAEERGVNFHIDVSETLPEMIFGDKQRIEQIIKNFLSNAFKFTHEGEVGLIIKEVSDDGSRGTYGLDKNNWIDIEVRDSGIGIPHEKLSKIFNAFEQVDGSTSREYGGTGLGLRICEELAVLLGGSVSVESEVGIGSTFILTIPLDINLYSSANESNDVKSSMPEWNALSEPGDVNAHIDESDISEIEVGFSSESQDQDKDGLILVVEDDEHFAAILDASIRAANINCMVARTGKVALSMAHQFRPSAIIMDIGLPDISGVEVFATLKNSPDTSHIPVYFMSVHDEENEMLSRGAAGYLTKPISQDQLDSALNTLINFSMGEHKVVLVVDDDPVTQEFIAPIFEQKGFDVDFAASAEEALVFLEETEYSGMLLDLMLPGMSGLQLLQHMSKNITLKKPPVVVYSAKDMGDEERHTLEQYTNAFVAKNSQSSFKVLNDLIDEFDSDLHSRQVKSGSSHEINSSLIKKTSSGVEMDDVLKGRHVLIVDDDTRNIFALSLLLKQVGMMVSIADNGQKALDILAGSESFDIILMDIMMPVMDGYEAIEKIREQEQFEQLPIIAVTAKAMAEDRNRCLEIGATDYLAKPIEATELFRLMKKYLCRQKSLSKGEVEV